MQRMNSSFLPHVLIDSISANVHNVKSARNVLRQLHAGLQSLASFTDCSVNHSLMKTVSLLLGALPQFLWFLVWLTINDDTLFHRVLSCSNHVLHCLLADKRSHVYQLRSRPHDCTLTANDDTRNFIYRFLHCDIY